jgi:hypothetical protein
VVVGVEDGRQASRKTVLNETKRKVRTRAKANRFATSDEVGDLEVLGKTAVLGDDTNVMNRWELERLDSGKQRGVVDEGGDGGDIDRVTSSYLVPWSVLGLSKSTNPNVLMGVRKVLINARGVRKDDGRRNVLLVV